MRHWTAAWWMIGAAALAACGGGEGGAEAGGTPSGGEEEAAIAPAVNPAEAAMIRGVITFEGSPPAPEVIDMSEEPICEEKYTAGPPTTEEVVVADGHLANVFVYVKEGLAGEFPPPSEPVVLDQQGCRYHPHVLGVQARQPLLIRNDDAVLHNINTQPRVNRGFNISQPQAGMESRREFSRPEVMIPVKCDVHGWMSAYIGVLSHPYFSVSEADGSFEIGSLPPGTYLVEAWHEKYGTLTQEVSVGPAETAEISFGYDASMAGREVPLGAPLVVHTQGGPHRRGGGAAAAGR